MRVREIGNGLVSQVLREVITLFGQCGLSNGAVVFGECGVPLVRLTPNKSVEPVEAQPQRPVLPRRCHVERKDGYVMVLSDPKRSVSRVTEDGRDRRGVIW